MGSGFWWPQSGSWRRARRGARPVVALCRDGGRIVLVARGDLGGRGRSVFGQVARATATTCDLRCVELDLRRVVRCDDDVLAIVAALLEQGARLRGEALMAAVPGTHVSAASTTLEPDVQRAVRQ